MKLRLFLVIAFLSVCTVSTAQTEVFPFEQSTGFWGDVKDYWRFFKYDRGVFKADSGSVFRRTFRALDRFLIFRQQRTGVDTNYLYKPQNRWAVKAGASYMMNNIFGIGYMDNQRLYAAVHSHPEVSLNFSADYRGLGLSFSINPASFFGEKEDMGLGFSWYGQSWGYQLEARSTKSFSGRAVLGDMEFEVPRNNVDQFKANLSVYYVLNSKKFSFPAIINQGYVQKKSAGSVLLNADVKWAMLHAGPVAGLDNPPLDMNYLIGAVGAGYGYNFVLRNGMMLHASGHASLVLLNSSKFKIDLLNRGMHFSFPDFSCEGIFGMVWPFGKGYTGIFCHITDDSIGDTRQILMEDMRMWGRVTYGIRF